MIDPVLKFCNVFEFVIQNDICKLMLKLQCFENSGQFNTVAKFKKKHIWADLGPKIQSLDVSVNLKATDTDVCRYTIIISKV